MLLHRHSGSPAAPADPTHITSRRTPRSACHALRNPLPQEPPPPLAPSPPSVPGFVMVLRALFASPLSPPPFPTGAGRRSAHGRLSLPRRLRPAAAARGARPGPAGRRLAGVALPGLHSHLRGRRPRAELYGRQRRPARRAARALICADGPASLAVRWLLSSRTTLESVVAARPCWRGPRRPAIPPGPPPLTPPPPCRPT
jgi:hypothetical protein